VTGAKTFWSLASFVVLAYAISWGWTFPFVAAGDVVEKGVGWPTNLPAALGPTVAAFAVTAVVWGRTGIRDLLARMARWRLPWCWWAAALSPLAFLAVALAVAAAIGKLPRATDFGRYSGLPAIGVVAVAVIAILGALGEETGWRGFALPLLQRRYGALAAALLVTPIWAVWHLPFFFIVSTYRGFAPVGYVGFVFGLACGSIVLTWLYNGTGGSILACAVWHGLYNSTPAPPRPPRRSRRSRAPPSTCWRSCSSGSSCARADAATRRSSAPAEPPHRRPAAPARPRSESTARRQRGDANEGGRLGCLDRRACSRVAGEVPLDGAAVSNNLGLAPQTSAAELHLDLCPAAQVSPPPLPLRMADEDRQRPLALRVHDRDREAAAAAATAVGDEQQRTARQAMKRRAQQPNHEQVADALEVFPHPLLQSMDAIRRPSAAAGTTASRDGAGSVLVVGLSRSWG
jgi:membrane protease YdiL (CAAX protease family)